MSRLSKVRFLPWVGVLCLTMLVGACKSVRLQEGQHILRVVKLNFINLRDKEAPRSSDLLPYVSQKAGRRVIYNASEAEYSQSALATALYNMGYLSAHVRHSVDTLNHKHVRSRYDIDLGLPYRISNHSEEIADPIIHSLLHPSDSLLQKQDFPTERYATLLDSGARLSPDLLQAERKRITQILRNRGYWGFREDFVRFAVDTLGGLDDAWVRTRIDTTTQIYKVGQIRFFQGVMRSDSIRDAVQRVEGITFLSERQHHIRPNLLVSKIWLRPGSLYAQDLLSRSVSALSDLSAIRTLNVNQRIDSTAKTPTINLDFYTQPEKSKELTTDIVGTHSGGNLGTIASLSFLHNNIFGGAERLRVSANVGYEELGTASSNHLSYGVEAALRLPSLMIPFRGERRQRPTKGTTEFTLSYNYLTRPEFRRNVFSSSLAYSWSQYRYPAFRYVFKPLEIDYMRFGYMDESFIATVPEYDRMLNYRNQLAVSMSLMFSYNSSLDVRRHSSPFLHNVRVYLQTAGNLLTAWSALVKAPQDNFGAYMFNGTNIVQFFKGELDYSGLYRLGGKNALAYRASLATVVPYGNSRFLPVDLRYFSGGASSLRGWRVRDLGPGSMSRSLGTSIFHQVGDIRLDLSTELRLRVLPSWELAFFTDAGNIWTIRKYKEQAGGDFDFGRFYKEIAWNVGAGVRWDFDFFLLRLDAGLKLYDPQSEYSSRWVIGQAPFKDLIGVHFGIGYPF